MLSSSFQQVRHNKPSVRSTTGCLPCKSHKVKCDEERPSCRRCSRLGRKCEYRNNNSSSNDSQSWSPIHTQEKQKLISEPRSGISSLLGRDPDERRAFEFYFRHAAPAMSNVVDMAFWRGIVLQLCQTEPAIWDALITISSLYENQRYKVNAHPLLDISDQSTVDDNYRRTLRWYTRSLSNIRTQLQRGKADIHVSLITCILYICIETMQGHMDEGLNLYRQGVKLVSQLYPHQIHSNGTDQSRKALTFLEDVTLPVYVRLGIVSSIITGASLGLNSSSIHATDNTHFSTVFDAYMSLHKVIMQSIEFHDNARYNERKSGVNVDRLEQHFRLEQLNQQSRLDDWRRAFEKLDSVQGLSKSTEYKALAALLRLSWACASIIVTMTFCHEETAYDQYMELFEEMIKDGETSLAYSVVADGSQPGFTFEMGVGLPLCFVAMKCRSPRLRREAIRLLQRAPPIQGLYKCSRAVYLACKVVEIEEERKFSFDYSGLDENWRPDESRRLQRLYPEGDSLSSTQLRVVRNRWDSDACAWLPVEESISLEEY